VKIQHLGVSGWLAYAEGKNDDALTLLREAADREDKTEKNAVTPGPIAPAREQLGEMLLEMNQPQAALAAFETTLKKEPNRYRALAGAALAEQQMKVNRAQSKYAKPWLDLTKKADGPVRPELAAYKKGGR
jgi:Tfp pilus assembly protein PilF